MLIEIMSWNCLNVSYLDLKISPTLQSSLFSKIGSVVKLLNLASLKINSNALIGFEVIDGKMLGLKSNGLAL